MAFDLNAFLQENRRFLAGTIVAVALFGAGTAVVGALYGSERDRARAELLQLSNRAAKEPLFTRANQEEAKELSSKLAGSVDTLAKRLRFQPRPQFQLKDGGASPANQYLDIAARMREERLDDARSRGVDLVDSAGVPERAPTQIEEIRRTLLALDLVDRAIRFMILSGVRSIERVTIVLPRTRADRKQLLYREEIRVEFDVIASSRTLSTVFETCLGPETNTVLESFEAQAIASSSRYSTSSGEALMRASIVIALLDPAPPKEKE